MQRWITIIVISAYLLFFGMSIWYHWINPPTKYVVIKYQKLIEAVEFGYRAANSGHTLEQTRRAAKEKFK